MLLSSTYGAGADGRVVVGLGWDGCSVARAFRWEESTGMVNLGSLTGGSTRANGVSAQAVAETNYVAAGRRLRPGTELVIPVAPKAKVAAAPTKTTAPPVLRAAAHAPRDRTSVKYRVEPGDTLASIAALHGTTVKKLQDWNALKGTRIAAGRVLTIYTEAARQ